MKRGLKCLTHAEIFICAKTDLAFIEDYKIIKKILDYLGIDEFKRDGPPPNTLAVEDS